MSNKVNDSRTYELKLGHCLKDVLYIFVVSEEFGAFPKSIAVHGRNGEHTTLLLHRKRRGRMAV